MTAGAQAALRAYRKAWNAANKAKKAALLREWRSANPEASRAQTRKWQQANRAKSRADSRSWAAAHPEYSAEYARKKREKQAGSKRPKRCQVCKKPGKIFFDHCHKKGHFRGWLCNGCNAALGFVRDSASLLRKLADYLDADKAKQKECKKNGNKKNSSIHRKTSD